MDETRPNPDALLTRILAEESRKKRGHFRLFFGMAPGVGKTYAMLKAAQEARKDGIDIWVGLVETHGRPETEELIKELPVIPRKKIEYRGTIQEEMDLDAILEKKPQLVLVDELAHTNIPGSRHEKRYQDIIEILEAGIDVYSTMNVQHLESRADVVGLLTAVTVRETVPDSVFDLVNQIEVIDITPHELIDRLKEGKVYPGRITRQALEYFFQEANLSALREIALRVTADKIGHDLMGAPIAGTKGITAKLLVAVSHSPFSEKLIRTARRIVEDLEMPWVAIHVDTGKILNPDDQNRLVKNLELASEMGAETVTLHGTNIADAITEYAKSQKVVQMIVGRPSEADKWWKFPKASRFIAQLIRNNPEVDITVLQQPKESVERRVKKRAKKFIFPWSGYFQAVFWVFFMTGINYFLNPYIGYRAVGFLFLLVVVILSLFLPFTGVLIAAILSALIWNFFFIPPLSTFSINAPEDLTMFIAYFVIASVSGFLTFKLKRNQRIFKDREEKTRALYEILRSMTLVQGTKPVVELALTKIESLFYAKCCVLLAQNGQLSERADYGHLFVSENDRAVAAWSYNHGRMAGWSTDTLPLSRVLCLALKSGEKKFGVLVFRPKMDVKLNPDQQSLLIGIVNQIGIVVAKERYDQENREAHLLKDSERLHQTLLNCISHELRTPLTAIMGAATAMQSQIGNRDSSSPLRVLSEEIVTASERLNHVFENLLDVTRLESAAIKLKQEWFDIEELIHFAVERQKRIQADHEIKINSPAEPLYFFGDFELLAHAFSNLLLNAASYSPKKSEILATIQKDNQQLLIEIADRGPGIPENFIPHIFEKFYRLPGTPAGGLGLGLSITKNFIELHGGTIQARNNPQGGAIFSVSLPYLEPPKQIQESIT